MDDHAAAFLIGKDDHSFESDTILGSFCVATNGAIGFSFEANEINGTKLCSCIE